RFLTRGSSSPQPVSGVKSRTCPFTSSGRRRSGRREEGSMVWGRKEGERMPDDNARETSGTRPAVAGFKQAFYDLRGGPRRNIEVHRSPVRVARRPGKHGEVHHCGLCLEPRHEVVGEIGRAAHTQVNHRATAEASFAECVTPCGLARGRPPASRWR